MNKVPKVSACIIAYNHENYIADCLEGALAQTVDFSYEIVISEDCSTDNTRQIVKSYRDKYPDKIKLYLNEKNLGLTGNWVASLQRSTGEYVAICEGDDYWIDPNKLKKQVEFLENNPGFSLSMHNANVMQENKIIRQYRPANNPGIMDLRYLLEHGSGGPTCSLVIRNQAIKNPPGWFSRMKACDWTIQVIAAQHGKMIYLPEVMGVYRKHKKGANYSAKKTAQMQGRKAFALPAKYSLEMIDTLKCHFNHRYDHELNRQSAYWYNWYANEYLNAGDIRKTKQYAKKTLISLFPFGFLSQRWLTPKLFAKLVFLYLFPTAFAIKFISDK